MSDWNAGRILWPIEIEVMEVVGSSAPFDTGVLVNFTAQPAGTLLLGFVANDPVGNGGGTRTLPDQGGWSEVGNRYANGMVVWAKTSTGSETALSFTWGGMVESSLYVLALSASWVDGPHVMSLASPLDTMTSVGTVSHRLDFVISGFAPTPAPGPASPGEVLAQLNGRSTQRGNVVAAVPLGTLGPGSSVPGIAYSDFVAGVSLLVNVDGGTSTQLWT